MFYRIITKIRDWKFERRMAKQRKKFGYSDCDCWGMYDWFQTIFPQMILNLRDMKHGAPELEFEEFDNLPLSWVNDVSQELLRQKQLNGYEAEVNFWGEEKYFDRWWIILTRIAYCLMMSNESYEEIKFLDIISKRYKKMVVKNPCATRTLECVKNEFYEEYNEAVWGKENDQEKNFKKWWNNHFVVEKTDKKGKPLTYRLITNEPEPELKEKYWNREKEICEYRDAMKNEAFDLLKKYFFNLWD